MAEIGNGRGKGTCFISADPYISTSSRVWEYVHFTLNLIKNLTRYRKLGPLNIFHQPPASQMANIKSRDSLFCLKGNFFLLCKN